MGFDYLLKARCSIRKYSTRKVDFSDIISVCEAARYAPMAGNIFTVRLILVSEKKKKQELAEAALDQDFIVKAPYIIVVCSDLSNLIRSYGKRAGMYARQQAGAAIENMFLKATELGLATCWIGAFDDNAIKRILRIPEHIQVETLLPIANPLGKTTPKKKPELKMFLHFEKYGQRVTNSERKPSP